MPKREKSAFLSIDWDFFKYRGFEAKDFTCKETIHAGTPQEKKVNVVGLYDWGHSEGQPAFLQQQIWLSRYAAFSSLGLDVQKLTGSRLDLGCTEPMEFVPKIQKNLPGIEDYSLDCADSHAHGFDGCRGAYQNADRKPVKVVHFDAHADMGYNSDAVKREHQKGSCDCASWLWHAAKQGLTDEIELVYPDWCHDEWSRVKKRAHLKSLPKKVKISVFTMSEWLENATRSGPVVNTFVCRSSAWVPPWFDDEFDRFLGQFGVNETVCLDCTGLGDKIGAHDACTKREWNADHAKAYGVYLARVREGDFEGSKKAFDAYAEATVVKTEE